MADTLGGTSHVEPCKEPSNRLAASSYRRSTAWIRALLKRARIRVHLRGLLRASTSDAMLAPQRPTNQARIYDREHGRRLQREDRRLHPGLLTLLAFSLIGIALSAAQYHGSSPPLPATTISPVSLDQCGRESLTHPPGWTLSGSWTPDGSALLVVDILHNQILRYSESGRSLGTLPDMAEGAVERFFPSIVKSQEHGDMVLELATGRIVTLDSSGSRIAPKRDIFVEAVNGQFNVRSMFLWHPAGDDLIAVSDVRDLSKAENDDAAWQTRLVRIPLTAPSEFSRLKFPVSGTESAIDDKERNFYRIGNPFVAAVGPDGYLLRMKDKPRIYENLKGSEHLTELKSFDSDVPLPELPPFNTRGDIEAVLGKVETSSMPVGLFGWNQRLYVVTRTAAHPHAEWRIKKINPATDTVEGTAIIPLIANHVTIVPGPRRWAFIEKGHAYGFGDQTIDSLYFVPASRFERNLTGNICQ
jgi:hypothetical protein